MLAASMVSGHRCRLVNYVLREVRSHSMVRVVLAFDVPRCGRSGPCVLVRQ
jgi:hypothetical protein